MVISLFILVRILSRSSHSQGLSLDPDGVSKSCSPSGCRTHVKEAKINKWLALSQSPIEASGRSHGKLRG